MSIQSLDSGPEKYFVMSNPQSTENDNDLSLNDTYSEENNACSEENIPYTMYNNMYPDEDEENIEYKPSIRANDDVSQTFHFQISLSELNTMVANSIQDKSGNKPFRYLTGNFMRIFENQMSKLEGYKVGIQKRNNILYVDRSRSSTAYIRVNGDCKYCPKNAKVRYVFTIKNKPVGTEEFVEVHTKCRGSHQHNGVNIPQNYENRSSSCSSYNNESNKSSVSPLRTNSVLNENNKRLSNESNKSAASKIVMLAKRRRLSNINNVTNVDKECKVNEEVVVKNLNGLSGGGLSIVERALVSEISAQVSAKIMSKLDVIDLKIDQICGRIYELERKFDNLERVVDEQIL